MLLKFSRDKYGHYLFTPRELTTWCLSLLRYNLAELKRDQGVETVLQVWAYEAMRIFHDRLVDKESRKQFVAILDGVLQGDWKASGLMTKLEGKYNLRFCFFSLFKTKIIIIYI